MFKCAASFVVLCIFCVGLFSERSADAEDTKYLTIAEASILGINVELTEYRPKVFNVKVLYAKEPKSAELVIRNEKDDWIATVAMEVRDTASSFSLRQEYVLRSYLYVHNDDNTGYQLPLR